MAEKVYYMEKVWNGYTVNSIPEEVEGDFERILKEEFNGNVWQMADRYQGMHIELEEACLEYVDTYFDTVSVD